MMTRLEQLKNAKRKLLIPFVTAGYLAAEETLVLMRQLVASGADLIELGVPFSDPMADGTVIQKASERALERGTSISDVMDLVSEFRKTDQTTPVVLMGYANPIENYGWHEFADQASKAGIDGVLTVDFPPEAMDDSLIACLKKNKLSPIFLVAPTTTQPRMLDILKKASGFIYFVSLKGVTGSGAIDYESISAHLTYLKGHTDLPVVAGFGIKDEETATSIAKYTDGVVIGSKIIEIIENSADHSDITEAIAWFASIRQALDDMEG